MDGDDVDKLGLPLLATGSWLSSGSLEPVLDFGNDPKDLTETSPYKARILKTVVQPRHWNAEFRNAESRFSWNAEFRNGESRFSQLLYHGQTLVIQRLTESKFGIPKVGIPIEIPESHVLNVCGDRLYVPQINKFT